MDHFTRRPPCSAHVRLSSDRSTGGVSLSPLPLGLPLHGDSGKPLGWVQFAHQPPARADAGQLLDDCEAAKGPAAR